MASRYRWRQQLLGSLQGQLQLATYLVVFLGFTGASSVGLLIGQRNLLANDQQLARQSIALCEKAIQSAFDDTEADTLYLMSDGRPNRDRNGGDWSNWDHQDTTNHYAGENNNRQHNGEDRALIVNTTSLGLESPWLEKLSELTQGYYNQIDKDSLTDNQDGVS